MGVEESKVSFCNCERCGHEWVARKERLPLVCPKCQTAYWNIKKLIRVKPLPHGFSKDKNVLKNILEEEKKRGINKAESDDNGEDG